MDKKSSTRFMKQIVTVCLYTNIIFAAAAYISAWFGVDTVPVLSIVGGIFGGELVLTVVLRLLQKDEPKNDKGEG